MTVQRSHDNLQGQKINADGAALVSATMETELSHASEDGDAYSYTSVTQVLGAAETGLLVKNTDTKPLHIETVWLSTDTDGVVQIAFPTVEVTAPDGVNAKEVNLNTGKPSDGDRAVAKSDETTNVQGDIFWEGEIMAAANPFPVDMKGAPRLIKNKSIVIDSVPGVGAFSFVVFAHFEK